MEAEEATINDNDQSISIPCYWLIIPPTLIALMPPFNSIIILWKFYASYPCLYADVSPVMSNEEIIVFHLILCQRQTCTL